jgi:hypothetical protein
MEAKELAVNHSIIIDAKLKRLHEVFNVVRNETQSKVKTTLHNMLVDDKGVCIDCKENRILVNKALGVVRNELRKSRPMINGIYGEGVLQIELLATTYINWLKSNG